MREIGILFIYVEYPALDSLDKHLAVYLSPARQAVLKQIHASIHGVQKQARPGISYSDYCTTTRELISTLMTQGQNPIYMDQMSRQGGDAVTHAAAVAHLSLLLGIKLDQYLVDERSRLPAHRAKDIVNLGVAGMLHDIGVSKLPEHLHKFSDADRPADEAALAEWQSHAEIGYDLIRNDVEATAAAAVYQHHQHFDGGGFPRLRSAEGDKGTMEGKRIHVFARIILAANLYDRLASGGPGGARRSNLKVHELIQSIYSGRCDPEVLKVLQAVVPPYPPGSRLKLSDGSFVIVTDVHATAPMKPVVRKLGADLWTLVGDPIDLRLNGTPDIVEAA
jgi:HD-GYP domain-containing protein (c-di-GMP phosphodiesterase class II)